MRPVQLAWRSLGRQPARAVLGIAGVVAVGALLLDMLLLADGLVVSFRGLLDTLGFDVRVTATPAIPYAGPRIEDASSTAVAIRGLDEVADVVGLSAQDTFVRHSHWGSKAWLLALGGPARGTYRMVEGTDLPHPDDGDLPSILLNVNLARTTGATPGKVVEISGECGGNATALPWTAYRVAGIVTFTFESIDGVIAAVGLDRFAALCGESGGDAVDFFLVASSPASSAPQTVQAIRTAFPELHSFSNEQYVRRYQRTEFSYFKIVSTVLSTITLFFAFLLIASLLTVSVNQRLAEVATLRAIGFRRSRVIADLVWESFLLVGTGGILAIPAGAALAWWLDTILRGMPGIPRDLHFFVYQPRVLVLYAALMVGTALLAALYPVILASRLPIASTLRKEVVS